MILKACELRPLGHLSRATARCEGGLRESEPIAPVFPSTIPMEPRLLSALVVSGFLLGGACADRGDATSGQNPEAGGSAAGSGGVAGAGGSVAGSSGTLGASGSTASGGSGGSNGTAGTSGSSGSAGMAGTDASGGSSGAGGSGGSSGSTGSDGAV